MGAPLSLLPHPPNGRQLLSPHREAWSDGEMSLGAARSHTSAVLPQKPPCLLPSCPSLESLEVCVKKQKSHGESCRACASQERQTATRAAVTRCESDRWHRRSLSHPMAALFTSCCKNKAAAGPSAPSPERRSLSGC